jgi:hypothetical protein
MDKELLESVMKLRGINIRVARLDDISDDKYSEGWTFTIDGVDAVYSVAQYHLTERGARDNAERIVKSIILGE